MRLDSTRKIWGWQGVVVMGWQGAVVGVARDSERQEAMDNFT